MKAWLLFGLLIVKHFVISNALDVGYSEARRRTAPNYHKALMLHVSAEALLTAGVFWYLAPVSLALALAVEAVVQVAVCLMERKAPIEAILRTHVLCEVVLLVCYAALVAIFIQ
jgi:hypothetical protein